MSHQCPSDIQPQDWRGIRRIARPRSDGRVALDYRRWRSRRRRRPAAEQDGEQSGARSETPTRADPLPGRWVWPLGVLRGRKPEISDGYSSKRRAPNGQLIDHGGVDLMYGRRKEDPWHPGTPNGTPTFVMPDHRAALAASDGVVSFAANTPRGGTVIIDHAPRKLATYYTHLSKLLVRAGQRVKAGAPLGVIGADPLDGQHLAHLHFETWRGGASDRFDPQPLMLAGWEYLADPGDQPVLVARNVQVPHARTSMRARAGTTPPSSHTHVL